jgi:hypothetical protein
MPAGVTMNGRQGPNPFFQSIISNKVVTLVNEAIHVGYLKHPLLKGRYREYGIGRLLLELLPQGWELGSGLMHDCNGTETKEMDLLIWNRNLMPPLLFGERNGVYPIESCFYTIEVKSELNGQTLDQAFENAQSIHKLQFLANYLGPIKGYPVKVLFAYGSNLTASNEELERYKSKDPNWNVNPLFTCLCIIGKGYYSFVSNEQNGGKGAFWLWFKPDETYYEVLGLMGGILNTLTGRNAPDYGYYILYPEGDKHGEILPC